MLQLCFGDSVKGSLKCAPVFGREIGGATAVVLASTKPLDTPLKKAAFSVYRTVAAPFYKRRARKAEARRRAEAIPVDYHPDDVLALVAGLNEGPIAGDLLSEARRETVRAWLCFAPHGGDTAVEADVANYWQACQKDLQTLLARAHAGEPVRIWCDYTPDSQCGLHAAAALLEDVPCAVTIVEAPKIETKGTVIRSCTLGERNPGEMGKLLQYERPMADTERHTLAAHWRTLQRENAPLRAMVDGKLRSVPINFYDTAIWAKVPEGEFVTAQLIGIVLSQCDLGIGDQLIYRRIAYFIKEGRLKIVTKGEGPYQHMLCRV